MYRVKLKNLAILTGLLLVSAAPVRGSWLGTKGKGTTAAGFLKIENSAVAPALGGAYTALSEDISGIEINPSGIAHNPHRQIEGMHIIWFEDVKLNSFSYKQPLGSGQAALSYKGLYTDGIEKRKEAGDYIEKFGARSHLASASYAFLRGNAAYGLTLKYIYLSIDDETADAFAIDGGMQYKLSERLRLGAAAKNIGTGIKFISKEYSLPAQVSLGGAYDITEEFTASADVNLPSDNQINFALGCQYRLDFGSVVMPLRAGIRTLNEFDFKDSLSAGVGLVISENYYIDSAWVPYGTLGDTFRVSLKANF